MTARWTRLVALAIFASFAATVAADAQQAKNPDAATTPIARSDKWWQDRFNSMNARVKQGNVDLIFIGDSITHFWETTGKDVWKKYYSSRNAVNLGIMGDETSHVLWRLDHGNINGISPKLAVVMIGTNNTADQNAEQIARGVAAVVERLKTKLPKTRILLLAIFPRGDDNNDSMRKVTMAASALFAKLADNKQVFYEDVGPKLFSGPNGAISHEMMPDQVHPCTKGYEIWAEAIEPMVAETLGK